MRHGEAEVTASEGGAVSVKRRVPVGLWKRPLVIPLLPSVGGHSQRKGLLLLLFYKREEYLS